MAMAPTSLKKTTRLMRAAVGLTPAVRARARFFGNLMRNGKGVAWKRSILNLDARYYGMLLTGLIIRF